MVLLTILGAFIGVSTGLITVNTLHFWGTLGNSNCIIPDSKYKVKKKYEDGKYNYYLYRCKYGLRGYLRYDDNLDDVIEYMKDMKKKDNHLKNLKDKGEDNVWLSDDELMVEGL